MSMQQNPQVDTKVLPTDANKGRESNGRFAKGNSGGPGNPYARQSAMMRQAFLDRVSEEKLNAMIDSMVELAIKGDVPAAKLVFHYVIGKPMEAVNPDTLDQQEFDQYRRANGMYAESARMVLEPDSKLPVALLRGTREGMCDSIREKLVPALRAGTMDAYKSPAPKPNGDNGGRAPIPNGSNGGAGTGGQAASGTQEASGTQHSNDIQPTSPIGIGGNGVNRVNRHGEARLPNGGNRVHEPSGNGKLHAVNRADTSVGRNLTFN